MRRADAVATPHFLTELGWVAPRVETLTITEAAARLELSTKRIANLARCGVLDAVKVERYWLIDGASLAAYDARRRLPRSAGWIRAPRLPAGPLLRQIELRGGGAACGVEPSSAEEKAIERASEEGSLTVWAADQLAVRVLGMTPLELWGGSWEA